MGAVTTLRFDGDEDEGWDGMGWTGKSLDDLSLCNHYGVLSLVHNDDTSILRKCRDHQSPKAATPRYFIFQSVGEHL